MSRNVATVDRVDYGADDFRGAMMNKTIEELIAELRAENAELKERVNKLEKALYPFADSARRSIRPQDFPHDTGAWVYIVAKDGNYSPYFLVEADRINPYTTLLHLMPQNFRHAAFVLFGEDVAKGKDDAS